MYDWTQSKLELCYKENVINKFLNCKKKDDINKCFVKLMLDNKFKTFNTNIKKPEILLLNKILNYNVDKISDDILFERDISHFITCYS